MVGKTDGQSVIHYPPSSTLLRWGTKKKTLKPSGADEPKDQKCMDKGRVTGPRLEVHYARNPMPHFTNTSLGVSES